MALTSHRHEKKEALLASLQEQNMNCSWSQDHKAWYLNKVPFTAIRVAHPPHVPGAPLTGAPDTPLPKR